MQRLKAGSMLCPALCSVCSALPRLSLKTNSFSSSSLQCSPWSGLEAWRESPINEDRIWGPSGPQPLQQHTQSSTSDSSSPSSLAEFGALVLSTSDPLTKSKLSHLAFSKWKMDNLPLGVSQPPSRPARPPKPQLEIPAPKDSGLPLNAYMLHNLAHVELNAIDLAWDTVVRFSPFGEILGEGFFVDFARVADDESRHFSWCSQRLAELGYKYGDMPAHNVLWRECEKTSDNVAARLAAIPLVQEARGLDAGPRLVQRLIGFGDLRTSNIVTRIAEEEVAHVAVGVHWFVDVCQKLGCAPCSTFKDLLKEYNVELKGPFNYTARDVAGIPRDCSKAHEIIRIILVSAKRKAVSFRSKARYDVSETSSSAKKQEKNEQLSRVYNRLASIISMESENSSLNGPPE